MVLVQFCTNSLIKIKCDKNSMCDYKNVYIKCIKIENCDIYIVNTYKYLDAIIDRKSKLDKYFSNIKKY